MSEPARVLSLQTRLLGNATFAALLRRSFEGRSDIAFRSLWADEERERRERSLAGRLVFRTCFTHSASPWIRERNADLFALRYELGSSYWTRRLLDRELAIERPDVLHFHTQSIAYASLATMGRIPTVISGDMTSVRNAEQFTRPHWRWTHAPHHRIEAAALRTARALIPFSNYTAQSMIVDYGVDPARVHVIMPGVNLAAFAAIGRNRSSHPEGPRRILFIGGEFERKGGDVLIQAFLQRFADRDDVELDLVTTQPPTVRHPRIHFHTAIRPYSTEWQELYNRAHVVSLPSRREAYGFVYLEGAAAGLPVVGSTVGAGPELIEEARSGFLVPPNDPVALGDRLKRLIDDPDLALRLGTYGRHRVERDFNNDKKMRDFQTVFANVAPARRAP